MGSKDDDFLFFLFGGPNKRLRRTINFHYLTHYLSKKIKIDKVMTNTIRLSNMLQLSLGTRFLKKLGVTLPTNLLSSTP